MKRQGGRQIVYSKKRLASVERRSDKQELEIVFSDIPAPLLPFVVVRLRQKFSVLENPDMLTVERPNSESGTIRFVLAETKITKKLSKRVSLLDIPEAVNFALLKRYLRNFKHILSRSGPEKVSVFEMLKLLYKYENYFEDRALFLEIEEECFKQLKHLLKCWGSEYKSLQKAVYQDILAYANNIQKFVDMVVDIQGAMWSGIYEKRNKYMLNPDVLLQYVHVGFDHLSYLLEAVSARKDKEVYKLALKACVEDAEKNAATVMRIGRHYGALKIELGILRCRFARYFEDKDTALKVCFDELNDLYSDKGFRDEYLNAVREIYQILVFLLGNEEAAVTALVNLRQPIIRKEHPEDLEFHSCYSAAETLGDLVVAISAQGDLEASRSLLNNAFKDIKNKAFALMGKYRGYKDRMSDLMRVIVDIDWTYLENKKLTVLESVDSVNRELFYLDLVLSNIQEPTSHIRSFGLFQKVVDGIFAQAASQEEAEQTFMAVYRALFTDENPKLLRLQNSVDFQVLVLESLLCLKDKPLSQESKEKIGLFLEEAEKRIKKFIAELSPEQRLDKFRLEAQIVRAYAHWFQGEDLSSVLKRERVTADQDNGLEIHTFPYVPSYLVPGVIAYMETKWPVLSDLPGVVDRETFFPVQVATRFGMTTVFISALTLKVTTVQSGQRAGINRGLLERSFRFETEQNHYFHKQNKIEKIVQLTTTLVQRQDIFENRDNFLLVMGSCFDELKRVLTDSSKIRTASFFEPLQTLYRTFLSIPTCREDVISRMFDLYRFIFFEKASKIFTFDIESSFIRDREFEYFQYVFANLSDAEASRPSVKAAFFKFKQRVLDDLPEGGCKEDFRRRFEEVDQKYFKV